MVKRNPFKFIGGHAINMDSIIHFRFDTHKSDYYFIVYFTFIGGTELEVRIDQKEDMTFEEFCNEIYSDY